MPCLEITMPEVNDDIRELLAKRLTKEFAEATGFDADIFGILFRQYHEGEASSGGAICTKEDEHPYIHFLLYSPRLKRSAKMKLVEGLSREFVATTGKSGWQPVIHMCEHPYDNVGVNGKLLSAAYPELKEREFYYDVPDD